MPPPPTSLSRGPSGPVRCHTGVPSPVPTTRGEVVGGETSEVKVDFWGPEYRRDGGTPQKSPPYSSSYDFPLCGVHVTRSNLPRVGPGTGCTPGSPDVSTRTLRTVLFQEHTLTESSPSFPVRPGMCGRQSRLMNWRQTVLEEKHFTPITPPHSKFT